MARPSKDSASRGHRAAPARVVRMFNNAAARGECPLCGDSFRPPIGSWWFLEGTSIPVCSGDECAEVLDVTPPAACTTRFLLAPMTPACRAALARITENGVSDIRVVSKALGQELDISDEGHGLMGRVLVEVEVADAEASRLTLEGDDVVLMTTEEAAAGLLLWGCRSRKDIAGRDATDDEPYPDWA